MRKNVWIDGIMGVVIGDALGMPVQFLSRAEVRERPVKTMEGYGTFNMPPGTWSDDSSMTLATLDSIREKKTIDCDDIMKRFVGWLFRGEYTPDGRSFDEGNTCMEAINHYYKTQDWKKCGVTGEWANGNGALMRILPVCLFARNLAPEKALEYVHEVSALTHNHLRSRIACGIYYFLVKAILDNGGSMSERLQIGIKNAEKFYSLDESNLVEWQRYRRLFSMKEFAKCKEADIQSSGYVVDSLEAAVWSLVSTGSFEEALLKAVNLGEDTDTVGAIAGGLAGLYYGYKNMPKEWLEAIRKGDDIIAMCELVSEEIL